MEGLIKSYNEKLERDIEDLQLNPNFADGVDSLYRDANMFVLVAVAIGLSPEKSALAPATPALVAAAQELAKATSLDEAKASFEKLQNAVQISGNPASLQWTKLVKLSPVMKKAIPSLSTDIKRLTRNEKTFKRGENSAKVARAGAAIALAALGCRPNVEETLAPNESALWIAYCDQLYQASMKFNEATHQTIDGSGSFEKMTAAYDELDATCNTTCHEKFGGSTAK